MPEVARRWIARTALLMTCLVAMQWSTAVEIPLDTLQPVRIGFVDLQRVFDTFPEKSFAEGDLLKEIDKRRRELSKRQTDISVVRQQINADENTLAAARAGQAALVPINSVPDQELPAPAVPPTPSTGTVATSSNTVHGVPASEAYPTEDPLAGLPGHETPSPSAGQNPLPGMKNQKQPNLLELLASATGPALLAPESIDALQKRVDQNHRRLDRSIAEFRNFRINAIGDMKVLQTEKTYDVMSKIYAILEQLAHDENITVVIDKSYILYGEQGVDLSDRLMARLQQAEGIQ